MKCICDCEADSKCDRCGKPICEECHGTIEFENHDKEFVCLNCFYEHIEKMEKSCQ